MTVLKQSIERLMMNAFLLTSSWQDKENSTELTFWWHTARGPLRQQVMQDSVCFIDAREQTRAENCARMLGWPVTVRPVDLKSFSGEPLSTNSGGAHELEPKDHTMGFCCFENSQF